MYHKLTIEETLKTLDVNPETGLSDKEARERVAKEKNPDQTTSFFGFLLEAFARPSIYILLIAAGFAVIFGKTMSAFSLLAVTAAHILFSAVYRFRGERTLSGAVSTSVTHAIVLRNGAKMKIKSDRLVVGDVVTIKPGRVVPADLRLISCENLVIDESALTGFDYCEKDCSRIIEDDVKAEERVNCAFEGTVVIHGRGDGVVVATGMSTEMSMLTLPLDAPAREISPTFAKLSRMSKIMSVTSVLLALVTFLVGFIRKDPLLTNVLTATALIAATVPYGVHSLVLGVIARGAKILKNLGFSVKSAKDIENAGAVSVLVTEIPKIGVVATYTNGRVRTPNEEDTVPFIDGLLLCEFKNPSLKNYAETKCKADEVTAMFPRCGELSGEITTTLHRAGNTTVSYSGGDPRDIVARSNKIWELGKVRSIVSSDREDIDEAINAFTEEGYSLTALGMRFGDEAPFDSELIFLGIVATCAEENPATTVNTKELKGAGVRVYLLTEEDAEKARLGAAALSLPYEKMIFGREVRHMTDEELAGELSDTFVFAGLRVQDKVRIINLLKSCGKTVAAIGDRVSDAPVLEAADVGISDIRARDVAKDASGILLDGTTPPQTAILCGKVTRANIKKSVTYIFATSLMLLFGAFAGAVTGFGFPLSAIQILLLGLVAEIFSGGFIPKSKKVPAKSLYRIIYGICIAAGFASAAATKTFLSMGNTPDTAQWYTFAILAAVELLLLVPLCFSGRRINGK